MENNGETVKLQIYTIIKNKYKYKYIYIYLCDFWQHFITYLFNSYLFYESAISNFDCVLFAGLFWTAQPQHRWGTCHRAIGWRSSRNCSRHPQTCARRVCGLHILRDEVSLAAAIGRHRPPGWNWRNWWVWSWVVIAVVEHPAALSQPCQMHRGYV